VLITENNKDNIDIFLAYLDENRDHLRNKPRTTFYGGFSGKHKFILPEANPNVKPIII
jgi:hypothetical protein